VSPRRALAAAVALLSTAPLLGGDARAAEELTPANSILFAFGSRNAETLTGIDCGTTATLVKPLPAGSVAIEVVEPRVGDRDTLGGGTRVTAVTVAGTDVTITVLADGPTICDPSRTGVPPGEPVHWRAGYDVHIEHKRRVQATMRVFYESYLHGARWKLRPRTIRDTRAGAAPGARVTGIRWKRFGGRKAVGFGTLRLDYCRRGDNCPQDGKRIRVVARRPDYCKDSDKIEYLRLAGYIGGIAHFGGQLTCSP
jgi:hypothetical protein